MTDIACEHGLESVTVAQIVGRAGVSRKTFYELFEDRHDCLLAAMEQTVALAGERAITAYAGETEWSARVRAGLFALLELFDHESDHARLLIVLPLAAGPAVLARRRELCDELARVIEEGRAVARREPPPLAEEAIVGGVLGIVHARLIDPDGSPLVDLLGPLMSFIVFPFLGAGAARRELNRPLPEGSPTGDGSRASDPLEGLEMRLTYRTVRVLAAISEQPGLGNSQVGELAGIADHGQMSKLLARLARLDLIENTAESNNSSRPTKAWRLTPRGATLERAVRRASAG